MNAGALYLKPGLTASGLTVMEESTDTNQMKLTCKRAHGAWKGRIMYIKKAKIKNFKAIEDISIDFKPGVNLLIGDNGVGKTSILEAVTVALHGIMMGIAGVPVRNIRQEDIRFSMGKLGGASTGIIYHNPTEVSCDLELGGKSYHWTRSRKDETPRMNTRMDGNGICQEFREMTNNPKAILPLISFESEARVWQNRRGDFGKELKKKLNDRRCGYIGCLDYSLDVKGIQAWCLKMEMEAFQREEKIAEYEAFKEIVAVFMQKISDLEKPPLLRYSRQLSEMVYREEDTEMPISNLSAGYQSLLWMVMNLAYRLALLNPGHSGALHETEGVVLIDEIDMHLHPKWQWNVVNALEGAFPNVQFIAATHSPIVISACRDARLILIGQNREISYLPEAYGYSVKDVLELRQGSIEKPKEIQQFLNRFEKAANRDDFTDAENIITEMKETLGEGHAEVKKAEQELEMLRWVEEN